jgi:crotonobetainyl-CoA:carnitine CoA-transferase CaiB-like acyl-CoA transferase
VHVEVSMEEAWMQHWSRHIQQWAYSGHGVLREERGAGRQGFPHTVMTSDGWLYVLALNADWEPFAVFLGLEEFAARPWNETRTQVERWDEIEPRYRDSLASKTRYEWFAEAAKMGYTFAPIHDAFAVVESPQAKARGAFETMAVGEREVPVPRLPFASPAPRLSTVAAAGEHTDDVLREAGLPERTSASLRKGGARRQSANTETHE